MLALVFANWHNLWLVEQDVGSLEDRVGEEADACAVGARLLRLVFELGHAAGFTHSGDAIEHPGEFGVSGNMALDEKS